MSDATQARIMRLPEVKSVTGLGASSIYQLMSEGKFPRQVPLIGRRVGWNSEAIESWISDRLNESQQGAAVARDAR